MPEITQGLDDYQRIGDRVQGRYLYVKGFVQWDQSYISMSFVGGTSWAPPSTCRDDSVSEQRSIWPGYLFTS